MFISMNGKVLLSRFIYLEKRNGGVCLWRQVLGTFLLPVNLKPFSWKVNFRFFLFLGLLDVIQGVEKAKTALPVAAVAGEAGKRGVSCVAFFSWPH
ncbi:hypothetical protein [Desulfogranum marinum]|uniref:hypothetical protein n=1 Tax=Desulfogranum marinum TaxID=453220 RepID=UPI0029C94002|nr:hypothetical protein [Desulfogranum marinum]